jgi:histidine triad (HIT) family protein
VKGVKLTTMTESPSVFSRIVAREIPADIVFESERLIAFRDIAPKAPVHLLVVPKTEAYANVTELAIGDPELLSEIVATAQLLATEHSGGEYRLIFNTGSSAGQTVFHVHAHVMGAGDDTMKEGTLGL